MIYTWKIYGLAPRALIQIMISEEMSSYMKWYSVINTRNDENKQACACSSARSLWKIRALIQYKDDILPV